MSIFDQMSAEFRKILTEPGTYSYGSNVPMDEQEPPRRDDLWGFAVGDRVRVKAVGAHHGLTGKVHWTGGCLIAKFDVTCRDICSNVAFTATHRIADDGTIENVTEGTISCPPADLEHCD